MLWLGEVGVSSKEKKFVGTLMLVRSQFDRGKVTPAVNHIRDSW